MQQEAHDAVSKEQAAYREKKMSSEDVHNILLDVQLTYKREPAPKAPNSDYDSTDKLNIIIKGWCKTTLQVEPFRTKKIKQKEIKEALLTGCVVAYLV